ncbi:hypothetical protein LV779_30490 [Streptomyces thinghirensis]|nr:hypothetical protein [Streptomyces thinghirensis]
MTSNWNARRRSAWPTRGLRTRPAGDRDGRTHGRRPATAARALIPAVSTAAARRRRPDPSRLVGERSKPLHRPRPVQHPAVRQAGPLGPPLRRCSIRRPRRRRTARWRRGFPAPGATANAAAGSASGGDARPGLGGRAAPPRR